MTYTIVRRPSAPLHTHDLPDPATVPYGTVAECGCGRQFIRREYDGPSGWGGPVWRRKLIKRRRR